MPRLGGIPYQALTDPSVAGVLRTTEKAKHLQYNGIVTSDGVIVENAEYRKWYLTSY